MQRLRKLISSATSLLVALATLYLAFAIHYWLGWPELVRTAGPFALAATVAALWLPTGRWRRLRRLAAAALLGTLAIAYAVKAPVPQDWIPLQARNVTATFDGDRAVLTNFSDALHRPGEPSIPRWIEKTFDLSQLEAADLILQPFGNLEAFEHVMLSFRFTDGEHVVVSMEARRAVNARFDALAGFFRHDELFPMIGSERDLLWARMARTPPDELQFYPLQRDADELRVYFRRVLSFADGVAHEPKFYSTATESCLTTLIRIAPETFAHVPWWDLRRWVPGYSLGLFQDLGLVSDDLPPEDLAKRQTIRGAVEPPGAFVDDGSWSHHIRTLLARHGAAIDATTADRE